MEVLDGLLVRDLSIFLEIMPTFAVGSTLGAAIAARDKKLGRVILFIGDGSL